MRDYTANRIECVCEYCRKTFRAKPSLVKDGRAKYCSRDCYSKAKQNSIYCTCLQCGVQFQPRPRQMKKGGGKYCSNVCSGAARQKRVDCKCEYCGKLFTVCKAKFDEGAKYCSPACFYAMSSPVECVCLQCGNLFKKNPYSLKHGSGKYCSRNCYNKYRSGANSPHWRGGNSGYRGANWSVQRKAAYERDKGVCQHCGKKPCKGQRKFQVHHIKPYREFNGDFLAANQLTNLIVLCGSCHPRAERGIISVQPYLF